MNAYKMACLYYNPSKIRYENKKLKRIDLYKIRRCLLSNIGIKFNIPTSLAEDLNHSEEFLNKTLQFPGKKNIDLNKQSYKPRSSMRRNKRGNFMNRSIDTEVIFM